MEIFGIGTDLTNINRFIKMINKYQKKSFLRIFSQKELDYCFAKSNIKKQAASMASRFASKEALSKAIGIGVRQQIKLYQIEVLNNELGQPSINLIGNSKEKIEQIIGKNYKISISLSDEFPLAIAFIVISC